MFRRPTAALAGGLAIVSAAAAASPARMPQQPGTCVFSRVKWVGMRLGDGPPTHQPWHDSGSAISFTNGGYQVDYEQIEAVDRSKPGDKVMICFVSLPKHCPPNDLRGKVYTTTNLRTEKSWTMADAEHECGGA